MEAFLPDLNGQVDVALTRGIGEFVIGPGAGDKLPGIALDDPYPFQGFVDSIEKD